MPKDRDGRRGPPRAALWPSLAEDSLGSSHTPRPGAWRVPLSAPRDFGRFYERICGGRLAMTVGRRSAPPSASNR